MEFTGNFHKMFDYIADDVRIRIYLSQKMEFFVV